MTAQAFRYAIYLAPAADSAWGRFGAEWIGRCAAGGPAGPQRPIDGIDRATLAALTADPRRYGFHATLKPPFRLATGRTLDALVGGLRNHFAAAAAFDLPPLDVRLLGTFVGLVPSRPSPQADRIAEACVRTFDAWRAPLTERELARRRAGGLDERGQALLAEWGYPSVLDRFRLHFSLTGALDAAGIALVPRLLDAARERMPGSAMPVDSVCLFEERGPGTDLNLVERIPFAARGRLILVVGPSGAGKDSVLGWARARLDAGSSAGHVRFAQRTITRPADAGGEQHIAVDPEAFERLRADGTFALCWSANGHSYGIGQEIRAWLDAGHTVVVSASRAHLPEALRAFPQARVVRISASTHVLRQRLLGRGRESPAEIDARIARAAAFALPQAVEAVEILNDGALDTAGEALLAVLAPQGLADR